MPRFGNRQKIEQLTDERGHGRYDLAAAYDEASRAIDISRRPQRCLESGALGRCQPFEYSRRVETEGTHLDNLDISYAPEFPLLLVSSHRVLRWMGGMC